VHLTPHNIPFIGSDTSGVYTGAWKQFSPDMLLDAIENSHMGDGGMQKNSSTKHSI